MKLNKHERAEANIAGLTSRVQQAEMKLILAGRWPPLKPLPVFKYETAEYRASIEFDKTRGEWVRHKTSFPSNKIEELRGELAEMTMALPHGPAEVFTEEVAAEQQEQELEKEANRRLQTFLEWRKKYENGARYSQLQDYLSESQQAEIADSVRLTLTARQLQFNAKNVEYVFDALSKAGGRLATLIEIAQRNKARQEAGASAQAEAPAPERQVQDEAIPPTRDRRLQARISPASRAYVELGDANGGTVLNISETGMAVAAAELLVAGDYLPSIRLQLPISRQSIEISAQIVWLEESTKGAGIRFVDLTADARNQISNWIASEKQTKTSFTERNEVLTSTPVESLIPVALENFPTVPIESVFSVQGQTCSPEPIPHPAPHASEVVTPQIRDVSPRSFVEDLQEKVPHHTPAAGFRPQVRRGKVESSVEGIEDSPPHPYVLQITGFHVAAFAAVILFAVISSIVGLSLGRGPLGKRLQDAQNSTLAVDATSPTIPNPAEETTSQTSTPPAANTSNTPAVNPLAPEKEGTRDPKSFAKLPSTISNSSPTMESKPSANPEASPERNGATGLIARNVAQPAGPKPIHSPKSFGPISGPPRNSAPRRVTPAMGAAPHRSPPSAILVTAPAKGSKPFKVTFQEKPIAASSSFAMTSQLSVLVPPEPGPAVAHKPSRLQAGELVSFVWPRYPRPGDRYGPAETVKVRTTIGQLGQVLDVKLVSGSSSLLPAATSAIRQWRYKPTLLSNRPVQAQQDVTIEFRPPQYLSRVLTQHPPHN